MLIKEKMFSKIQKIKSIEKALFLIELLSENNELGITEISEKLNFGITTVYRILKTLEYHGYIIQNKKTFKYFLGHKPFIIGNKAQNIFNLVNLVSPSLKILSQKTIEGINFSVLEGREALCVYKIESSEILRTDIKIGSKLPAHCTAVGKAILAFLPNNTLDILYNKNEKLKAFTANTITSVIELKNNLKEIKKQGYAMDIEEYQAWVNCLGAPVLNKTGIPIGSISITGPSSRFDLNCINKLKNILISVSQDISTAR